jgi:hypothetical protein
VVTAAFVDGINLFFWQNKIRVSTSATREGFQRYFLSFLYITSDNFGEILALILELNVEVEAQVSLSSEEEAAYT